MIFRSFSTKWDMQREPLSGVIIMAPSEVEKNEHKRALGFYGSQLCNSLNKTKEDFIPVTRPLQKGKKRLYKVFKNRTNCRVNFNFTHDSG